MLREVAETGLTHGPEALAKEFALISRALAAEDFRLYRLHRYERVPVAIMDGSFPGFSTRTSALALALPKDIAETLTASMRVMWWASGQSPLSLTMCAAEWAVRISTAWPDPGILLPLSGEDRFGMIVFTGPAIAVEEERLMDIHARCHALFDSLPDTPPERSEPAPAISRRELQCLKLTAEGLTSEEIALRLGLSVHTANQYLANATEKLDAANRVHAVAKALRAGLID